MAIIQNPLTRPLSVDDRAGIIGGSQIGAILNMKGYGTQYSVWRAYKGYKDPIPEDLQWTFTRGHILEDAIAKMFAAKTGFELEEVPDALYDPAHPYLILHPDRQFRIPGCNLLFGLECKMTAIHAFEKSWDTPEPVACPIMPEGVMVYNEKSILPQYRAQGHWYNVFGYAGTFLARLTDNDIAIYWIPVNEKVERNIYNKVIEFHDDIESGWVPEQTKPIDPLRYEKAEKDSRIMADDDITEAYERLLEAKELLATAELRVNKETNKIKEFMKEKEILINEEGDKIASWSNFISNRISTTDLKAKEPEIYRKYLVPSSSRKFTLYEN